MPGCLRTYVTVVAALVELKPRNLSFEDAASLPSVFSTSELSLFDFAKLKKGERVLIHAATGGVGLAAVQLAQSVGAVIYATAGRKEKQDYLRSLGVQYITSSRDPEVFYRDMQEFLGKEKIHVVLNSLSADFIKYSVALLGPKGRFMEIGKRDIWSHERMAAERPDIHYETIALDDMITKDPLWYGRCLKLLATKAEKRQLTAPLTKVFNMEREYVEAFRYMQLGQHMGKIILAIPSSMGLRADATYLITGGFGALGLVFAARLIEEGARNVVLLSRSGAGSASAEAELAKLRGSGARVEAVKCDVSDARSVRAMLSSVGKSLPPVRGVLHSAGVLDDATIENQSVDRFERVFGAKVGEQQGRLVCMCHSCVWVAWMLNVFMPGGVLTVCRWRVVSVVGRWTVRGTCTRRRSRRACRWTSSCCSRPSRRCWGLRGSRTTRRRTRRWTRWRTSGGRRGCLR